MNEPLERSSSASPTTIKCTVETAPVVPHQALVRLLLIDLISILEISESIPKRETLLTFTIRLYCQ